MAGMTIMGRDTIMETFNKCGYDTFALTGGKTFIAGSGETELNSWIDIFCPPGVSGSFTLKLYDCSEAEVRSNSECALSFNCRVVDGYSGAGMGGFNSTISKRLEALEKEKGKGENEDKLTDAIMGWLDEPEKLLQVVGAVRGLFFPSAPALAPAAIGAVIPQTPEPGRLSRLEEQRYTELAGYLDTLEKADPHIVTHLGMLARLTKEKPETFKMLLGMLANQ